MTEGDVSISTKHRPMNKGQPDTHSSVRLGYQGENTSHNIYSLKTQSDPIISTELV